jgi:uncharacterized protein YceH (UPF0502 family)
MLRGAQTPGELKQRTERLRALADLDAVHAALQRLIERELVLRLERRPGQKEERYLQRLGEDADDAPPAPVAAPEPIPAEPAASTEPDPRLDRLEAELSSLRGEVGALRSALDALRSELGA